MTRLSYLRALRILLGLGHRPVTEHERQHHQDAEHCDERRESPHGALLGWNSRPRRIVAGIPGATRKRRPFRISGANGPGGVPDRAPRSWQRTRGVRVAYTETVTRPDARYVLIGATGQLGFDLARTFELPGTLLTPRRGDLDILDASRTAERRQGRHELRGDDAVAGRRGPRAARGRRPGAGPLLHARRGAGGVARDRVGPHGPLPRDQRR